jgi:hypothetical protein
MSFVHIPAIYTADPGDVWTPKNSFVSSQPFAIVMRVQASGDAIRAGLRYDAIFQMVNPRQDPFRGSWFTQLSSGDAWDMPTRNSHIKDQIFKWTDFAHWVWWPHYADAVNQIKGGEKLRGIFLVRGTIDILNSDLFAHSDEYWYKVVP